MKMGSNGPKVKAADVVPVAEARSSLLLPPSSVELPDVLTFVFSWQGYQLCIRTKYRGTEHLWCRDLIIYIYTILKTT